MSIADVSKTMSDLAAAINKKNSELEELKAKYTENLNVVQKYLEGLQNCDIPQGPEQFLELIKTPVECRQCGNKLHDIGKETDYVLVPKKPLELSSERLQRSQNPVHSMEAKLRNLHMDNPATKKPVHNALSSSKRTCSYCGKTGHSRSRCFTRLSKEPGSSKPS